MMPKLDESACLDEHSKDPFRDQIFMCSGVSPMLSPYITCLALRRHNFITTDSLIPLLSQPRSTSGSTIVKLWAGAGIG